MQPCTLNDDIALRIVRFLKLDTILSLSKVGAPIPASHDWTLKVWITTQTCQSFYRLSLSSLSFWINAVDAHQFPAPISTIRDHYRPEEVRYMARVICCYQDKIRGGRQQNGSNRAQDNTGIGLSSTTRIKFRQEGLVRMGSKGREGLLGVSSAFVQGHTADSLPWLVSVKEKIIRCDSIDEEYVTGIEWEADGLVDWFWKYDIMIERDGEEGTGRPKEYLIITFLTNGSATIIHGGAGPPGGYQE